MMKNQRGAVFAREPKYAVLGMIVDATIQEKLLGGPGWVKPPSEAVPHLEELEREGLVESSTEDAGWWRATKTAIDRHRAVSATAGRA